MLRTDHSQLIKKSYFMQTSFRTSRTLNAFPLPSNQSPPPKTSSATTFSTPMTCQWQQLARLTRSTALHLTPKKICHLTPYSLFCCDWLPPRLTPNKKNISNHNHHVTWTWEVESRMQTSFTGKVSGDVPEQKLRQISKLMSPPFCGEASNMITDDTHMHCHAMSHRKTSPEPLPPERTLHSLNRSGCQLVPPGRDNMRPQLEMEQLNAGITATSAKKHLVGLSTGPLGPYYYYWGHGPSTFYLAVIQSDMIDSFNLAWLNKLE